MSKEQKLFEFLCNLIGVQIEKYFGLATFGIGPDASINSTLVLKEVDELLMFAYDLFERIDKPIDLKSDNFDFIFHQIRFYLEQEKLRALAGWLLDENNIHTPSKKRIEQQLTQLKQIGLEAHIDSSSPAKPQTQIQKQCEHDSHAIAFLILDLAQKIKSNPEMEFDLTLIPKHAATIIKRNATIRYNQPEISNQINELHQQCKIFLDESTLEKSTSEQKPRKLAEVTARRYRSSLEDLMKQYLVIKPESTLFNAHNQWDYLKDIPTIQTTPEPSFFSKHKFTLGSTAVLAGSLLLLVINYWSQVQSCDGLKKNP